MKEIVNVKVSKAVEKELEIKQEGLRKVRSEVVGSIKDYWKDCEAVERVESMKESSDLLDGYSRELKKDECLRLMKRYEALDFLVKDIENGYCGRVFGMVREIVNSEDDKSNFGEDRKRWGYKNEDVKIDLISKDGIMINEIIWNSLQLKTYLALMKKLGFKEIYYRNSSTNCMEVVSELVEMGGIVVKSWIVDKNDKGLVIDIEAIELDKTLEEYIEEARVLDAEDKAKRNSKSVIA